MSEETSVFVFDNLARAEGFAEGVSAVEDDRTVVEAPEAQISDDDGIEYVVTIRRFA
jgi:hypothetical protein